MRPSNLPRIFLPLAVVLAAMLALAGTALAALGDRTLRQGSSGSDVLELQRDVTYLGYPTPRYGSFTSRTKTDILNYERKTGLTADGVVSGAEGTAIARRTREKQARESSGGDTSRTYSFGERVLRQGLRGDDVLTLQQLVTKLGYPTPRYGSFTSRTKTDILNYERKTGLTADGVVSLAEQRAIKRRADGGTSSSKDYVFPIRGPHSYGGSDLRFGAPRSGHTHQGQDVPAASGTPLVANTNGTIAYRQYQAAGAGYYIVLRGDDGIDYVYMHMREAAYVAPGQRVRVGQLVGRVGATGNPTGPTLHFEMWTARWYDGGRPFDPLRYLQRWDAYS